jgi:hypothetical protein
VSAGEAVSGLAFTHSAEASVSSQASRRIRSGRRSVAMLTRRLNTRVLVVSTSRADDSRS